MLKNTSFGLGTATRRKVFYLPTLDSTPGTRNAKQIINDGLGVAWTTVKAKYLNS